VGEVEEDELMRRARGLDGLRAVAVLGVLGYHADLSWLPGGFLGVDAFFVLSGYLITGLLLTEWQNGGRVDFLRFYRHRARRLLPGLLLMLVVASVAAMQLAPDAVAQLRRDLFGAVGYFSNWHSIFAHQSYFERMGRPPLLLHLWSLAVEEQFYLFWPPLLLLVLLASRRLGAAGQRRVVARVAVAGALASTAVMAVLSVRSGYPVPNDPSRVYYGTDTHACGLLLGAALAAVWPLGRLPQLTDSRRKVLDAAGGLALVGLVVAYTGVDEFSSLLYRGGFLLLSVVAAVAALAHPQSFLGSLLGSQPLRWVGERSYGLYLWHWPVFELTRPGLDVPLSGLPSLVLRLAVTATLTELSWRLVDTPVRAGALKRVRPAVVAGLQRTASAQQDLTARVALATGITVVLIGAGLIIDRPPAGASQVLDQPYPDRPLVGGPAGAPASPASPASPAPKRPTPSASRAAAPRRLPPAAPNSARSHSATPSPRPSLPATPKPATPKPATTKPALPSPQVFAYGDSVMLGASAALHQAVPGIRVNAVVGRQPTALVSDLRYLQRAGLLPPVVVIHSGDNGVFAAQTFDAALDVLSDRTRVVVVNVRVPRRWQGPVNSLLVDTVRRHPNAVLADWNAASANHPEYFVSDGVHLTVAGEDAFAHLIAQVLGGH